MRTLGPEELCEHINARLADLTYTYTEGEAQHTLAVEGHQPIRFPLSAGGGVHGGSASWVHKKHAGGAIHEPGLVAALLVLADERPTIRTIFDIGSLYGYVSLVARSLFQGAEVHAFEANPRSYKGLVRNLEANRDAFGDSIHAHLCALSDESARQVKMRIHRMSLDEADADGAVAGKGHDHQIDVWSLDDYCRELSLSPDLIKLDVEGYQAKIIPGALEVISRSRPVILLEFDDAHAANYFGVSNRDVIKPLLDDGYRLVWGKHRHVDARFRVLDRDELTDAHEVNSLGILVP